MFPIIKFIVFLQKKTEIIKPFHVNCESRIKEISQIRVKKHHSQKNTDRKTHKTAINQPKSRTLEKRFFN